MVSYKKTIGYNTRIFVKIACSYFCKKIFPNSYVDFKGLLKWTELKNIDLFIFYYFSNLKNRKIHKKKNLRLFNSFNWKCWKQLKMPSCEKHFFLQIYNVKSLPLVKHDF